MINTEWSALLLTHRITQYIPDTKPLQVFSQVLDYDIKSFGKIEKRRDLHEKRPCWFPVRFRFRQIDIWTNHTQGRKELKVIDC